MKIISILTFSCALALTTVACVESTSSTSSTDQSICTVEDQESGNCTLKWYTRQEAQSQVPGQTPTFESWGVCLGNYCAVRWELPHLVIVSVCIRTPDGVVCASESCSPGSCPTPGMFGAKIAQPLSLAAPDPDESDICTDEDINNGTCGDPGGGSPPSEAEVGAATDAYATSLVTGQYAEFQLVYATTHTCHRNTYGRFFCSVRLDFGSFAILAFCETGGHQEPRTQCYSRVE
jgi:hypothetical protein